MLKKKLINFLNNKYPFCNQEEWDQCGYDCSQETESEVRNILITLDLNSYSLKLALENDCNVIITHHPLFKQNLENPDDYITNVVNRKLFDKLNKNNILHIVLHTCYDRDKQGTSYQIFSNSLIKIATLNYELTDKSEYLVYGELKDSMTLKQLVDLLKKEKWFHSTRHLKIQENRKLKTFALGAGSCSSMINEVLKNQVDIFLTGDVKWHGFQDGLNSNLCFIDICHDAEQVFVSHISKILREFDKDLSIYKINNIGYITD